MTKYLSKTAAVVADLINKGSISASSVDNGNPETKAQFARLSSAGIVKKQRRGSGNCYQLLHSDKLSVFIKDEFPNGLTTPDGSDNANRTFGVLTRGDSKTISTLGFDLVMLRGTAELVINQEHHQLDNSNSAFLSLKISDKQSINLLKSNCRIITIENPTVFTELNRITTLKWDIAVYTAGKISTLLLNQLRQWETMGHSLTHFGDYDYVGLLEYARIMESCPQAELYYPTRLDADFIKRYGKSELHQKQIAQHQALLTKLETLPDSALKQRLLSIHELLQRTAKGLEQEAFLIDP